MRIKSILNTFLKQSVIAIALIFISTIAGAQQETARAVVPDVPRWAFDPVVYLLSFLILILLITIYALYKVNLRLINQLYPGSYPKSHALVTKEEASQKPTWFRKAYLRMVDSVPVSNEKDILLDHNYDGIKELDNNLPPWWKYGFYFTIVFSVFYLGVYHVSGTGKLQLAEYNEELKQAALQKEERMKNQVENITEENVVILQDEALIAEGKANYQKLCAACHLADGGGQVGPNLTDEYWLHGGGIKNVFKTITYGVPAKGMISWNSQLSPKQIQQVASYILSLQGTTPLSPKEPQGDKWVEAAANNVIDSTKVQSDTLDLTAKQ